MRGPQFNSQHVHLKLQFQEIQHPLLAYLSMCYRIINTGKPDTYKIAFKSDNTILRRKLKEKEMKILFSITI